jgi:hypothetical protein
MDFSIISSSGIPGIIGIQYIQLMEDDQIAFCARREAGARFIHAGMPP